MLLEMHVHSSKYSGCSKVEPVTILKQVKKKELQGVIITEHHYLWTDDDLKKLRVDAELDENFLILSGQEIQTDIGHVLVFGAGRTITDRIGLKELRELFPEAALIWAHPFRDGREPSHRELINPLLDGIEIFSTNHTIKENYLGLKMWHEYKFTALSGSDAHADNLPGMFPTQFDHPIENMEGLVREIKESRCRPFFKEIPKSGSNIVVTEITIGTKGSDEVRNRIILKNFSDDKKWETAKRSLIIVDALYKNGFDEGLFRVPKIVDVNDSERCIIEDGQRGKSLYDLILHVNAFIGIDYYKLSARWLAKLHKLKLKVSDKEKLVKKEEKRFQSYKESFVKANSLYTEKISILADFVQKKEEELFLKGKSGFIQCHGDYHPKNIIIGQDKMQDISTLFVSVIDFDSSIVFHPAFDVGYFLSQFQNQFNAHPEVINKYNEQYFIEAYMKDAQVDNVQEFLNWLKVFKIRANLSIASYLVKVGKGTSVDMESLIKRSSEILNPNIEIRNKL